MSTISVEPITSLPKCVVCGEPIMMHWKDKEKGLGKSELYMSDHENVVHVKCAKGKSLDEILKEQGK